MNQFAQHRCSKRSIVEPKSLATSHRGGRDFGGTMMTLRAETRFCVASADSPSLPSFQQNSTRWSAVDREIAACADGSNTAHTFEDAPLEASFLCAEDHGSDPRTRTVSSKQLNAQARNRKGG